MRPSVLRKFKDHERMFGKAEDEPGTYSKEECRDVYRTVQSYATDLREGRMTINQGDTDRPPLAKGDRETWELAVELNKAKLCAKCQAYLKELEKEEGRLLEDPPRSQQAPAAPPAPARQEPVSKEIQAKVDRALDYRCQLWLIMKKGNIEGAMRRMARWARTDPEAGQATIWKEILDIDWAPAVERVGEWTVTALKKVTKAQHVDLLEFQTGESPEIFAVTGYALKGGREEMNEMLKRRWDPGWKYWNWLRQSDLQEFLFKRTKSLPGEIWKLFPDCDAEPRLNWHAGSMIWDAVTRLGIARGLRHGGLDFARLLGDRERIAIVVGHEDPSFVGCLTPKRWDGKR